jgi:hypothetical protein
LGRMAPRRDFPLLSVTRRARRSERPAAGPKVVVRWEAVREPLCGHVAPALDAVRVPPRSPFPLPPVLTGHVSSLLPY